MRARLSGLASFLLLLNTTLELNSGILLEWSWYQQKHCIASSGKEKRKDPILSLNVPDLQLAEVRAALLGTSLACALAQQLV